MDVELELLTARPREAVEAQAESPEFQVADPHRPRSPLGGQSARPQGLRCLRRPQTPSAGGRLQGREWRPGMGNLGQPPAG